MAEQLIHLSHPDRPGTLCGRWEEEGVEFITLATCDMCVEMVEIHITVEESQSKYFAGYDSGPGMTIKELLGEPGKN